MDYTVAPEPTATKKSWTTRSRIALIVAIFAVIALTIGLIAAVATKTNDASDSESSKAFATPVFPKEGVRYYLKHKESGKYIHPRGGLDNPGDDTRLVLHHDSNRLALQFIFETHNRNGEAVTFLKHYGSGKYVHPLRDSPRDGVSLVLYSGLPNHLNLHMEAHGRMTFLTSDEFYVHPRGGKSDPADNTELVLENDFSSTVWFVIEPAEEVYLVDFQIPKLDAVPESTSVVGTFVTNTGTSDLKAPLIAANRDNLQNRFEFSFSEAVSVKMQPYRVELRHAGTKTAIEFALRFGSTEAKTKATASGIESVTSRVVTVPPGRRVTLQTTTTKKSGTVPFVATMQTMSGVQVQLSGVVNLEVYISQKVEVFDDVGSMVTACTTEKGEC